jgi:hypothetical protein
MKALNRDRIGNTLLLLVSVISIILSSAAGIDLANAQTSEVRVEVFANQGWQNTGVRVQPGDTLTIQYVSGHWSPWPGSFYDGRGVLENPPCHAGQECVLFGVLHASLIGRIGNGDPFYIGNGTTLPVGQTEHVYLRINDSRLGDNSGSLIVRVQVTPLVPTPQPAQISFTVNPDVIVRGQCATLRWDVENVRAVELDGQGVVGHDSREVCPPATTTYTLRVITDSGDVNRAATVTVLEPTATPIPTNTWTPVPPTPTGTWTPVPPTPTATWTPAATATPTVQPTNTPIAEIFTAQAQQTASAQIDVTATVWAQQTAAAQAQETAAAQAQATMQKQQEISAALEAQQVASATAQAEATVQKQQEIFAALQAQQTISTQIDVTATVQAQQTAAAQAQAATAQAQQTISAQIDVTATVRAQQTPTAQATATPGPDAWAGFKGWVLANPLPTIGVFVEALAAFLLILAVVLKLELPTSTTPPPPTGGGPTPPPQPPLPASPYLECPGRSVEPRQFPLSRLDQGGEIIGQAMPAEGVTLRIDENFPRWDTVSRQHARIVRDPASGRVVIEDLGSQNGVYVQGRRTARNLLKEGWNVAIGGVEFVYHES